MALFHHSDIPRGADAPQKACGGPDELFQRQIDLTRYAGAVALFHFLEDLVVGIHGNEHHRRACGKILSRLPLERGIVDKIGHEQAVARLHAAAVHGITLAAELDVLARLFFRQRRHERRDHLRHGQQAHVPAAHYIVTERIVVPRHAAACEDNDRDAHHDDGGRRRRAGTRDAAGHDLGQSVVEGLQILALDEHVGARIPKPLEGENNQGQPCRLDQRHDNAPKGAPFAGAVNAGGFQQRVGNAGLHELLHQIQPEGGGEGWKNQGGKSVDHMQLGHDEKAGHLGDGRAEHQRQHDDPENQILPGEMMLGQRVRAQGGDDHMPRRAHHRHKQGVEQVAGEGHPAVAHHLEQVRKIFHRGIFHEKPRRIHPQLIQRLEGVADGVHQRQGHEQPHQRHHHHNRQIATQRTVEI